MGRKSDDSLKFEHLIWTLEVFLLTYYYGASPDILGLSRKICLEQKSMLVKFDDGGEK